MENRNPAGVISGVVILADALAARLALSADDARVYVLGHPIGWECAMRRAGLPCPTCGLTRSVVMALHGDLSRAWHMAPGGPVLLAGALLAAVALLVWGVREKRIPQGVASWLRAGAMVYAAAATAIWLGGWAEQFHRALYSR
jgi:hypothetical protein